MVKLNLTGMQTAENAEIPAWDIIQDGSVTEQTSQDTNTSNPASESIFSFSLSSLIWKTNEVDTKQESTQTQQIAWESIIANEETPVVIEPIIVQEVQQEQPAVSIISQASEQLPDSNVIEDVISITGNEEWAATSEETSTEAIVAPIEDENKEFFKNFDIIKEFDDKNLDDIVIGKWEDPKAEITNEMTSVSIMWEDSQDILDASKKEAEKVAETIEATQIENTEEVSIISEVKGESINLTPLEETTVSTEAITAEEEIKNAVVTEQTTIEQAKIDLSITRKPFGIKSFNKKSVITSLWAVFLLWMLAFWVNQMGLIGGKANIQELNNTQVDASRNLPADNWDIQPHNQDQDGQNVLNNEENTPSTATQIKENSWAVAVSEPTKYVIWTDFEVIKNKRKNIRKVQTTTDDANSWALINTWESENIPTQIPNDTNIIPATNQEESLTPMTPPTWDGQMNDMNEIANWIN